jgi:hypothetical protein
MPMNTPGAKVGHFAIRNMVGIIMKLRITEITDSRIICDGWEFDRETGAELDDDLGWTREYTGSYLIGFEDSVVPGEETPPSPIIEMP